MYRSGVSDADHKQTTNGDVSPKGCQLDDLSAVVETSAPVSRATRILLEQQALDKHAARKVGESKADLKTGEIPNGKHPATPPGGRLSLTGRKPAVLWSGFVRLGKIARTVGSWADYSPWAAVLLVQIIVFASYARACWYEGYKMDDTVAIERNPNVVAETATLDGFMRRDFWGLPMHGAGWTNKSFRPLTTLSFRLNYLLHGLQSSGFFLANVLLHCLSSVLVGRLGTSLAGLSGSWAALASLFFGVHPVHTENVLYIVGRADILSTVLGAIALILYASLFCPAPALTEDTRRLTDPNSLRRPPSSLRTGWANNPAWLVFPVVFIVASGLCKETGFTLFAMFMLMELLDFSDARSALVTVGERAWTKHWRKTHMRLRAALLLIATFLTFIARYRHTGGTSLNMSPQDNPISFESSKWVRMLSYAYLHGVYMRLLYWPQFLCYDYSMDAIPAVRTALDCRLLLTFAAYVGAFSAVSAALRAPPRYRRSALLSLALLVVPYLPASNILFPVGTVIGERLMYTPSAGFCLVTAVWLQRVVSERRARSCRFGVRQATTEAHAGPATNGATKRHVAKAAARERRQRVSDSVLDQISEKTPSIRYLRRLSAFSSLIGCAITVLTIRTWVRVGDWESSDTLFTRDGVIQPTSSKVQFNLGITHMQRQEWDEAVEALIRCAWADPLSSLPFFRIGQIEILRGRTDVAESFLSASLDKFGASLMVPDEEVFHDLAVAMFQNGKPESAEIRLRVALQLNPDFAKGWSNLACCIASRDLHDATRAAKKAVSLAPDNPQYWANLALLSQHTGDRTTAASAWQAAQELWPSMPEPRDCTWEFAPAG